MKSFNISSERIEEAFDTLSRIRDPSLSASPNSLEAIGALAVCGEALRDFKIIMNESRLIEMEKSVGPSGYVDTNLLFYTVRIPIKASTVDRDYIKCGLKILRTYRTALEWDPESEEETGETQ